jgi:hypothetical protein
MSKLEVLYNHVEEYIARYTVLAMAILVPLAGLLGQLAADLGGNDTPAGRAVLGAAAMVGSAAGFVIFLKNLGEYQKARDFGSILGDANKLIQIAKQVPDDEATVKARSIEPPTDETFNVQGSPIGPVGPGQQFPEA